MDQVANNESDWNPYELLGVLRKNWWLVLLVLLAGVTVAAFYSLGQTKIYRASAMILIDPTPPKPLGKEVQNVVDVGVGIYTNNADYYQTQYDILKSRSLAMKTVERLHLDRDPSFITNRTANNASAGPDQERVTNAEQARISLQERLTVNPVRDSRLVHVSVDDADAERAKSVLRTLLEIYIDDNVDSVLASTQLASEWLAGQLQKLKQELSDSELALHTYKKDHQILSVALDDQSNMLRDEMQQLNQALTRVRTELQLLKARDEQLSQVDVTEPMQLPVQELLQSSILGALRQDYVGAKQDLEGLLHAGKGENHPEVLAARAHVDITKDALLNEVQNIREALSRDLKAKKREEEGLAKLFASSKTQALELNRLGLEYGRLERARNNTEKVYSLVLERSKESDLTRYMRFNNIRVVDEAFVGKEPVRPRTPLNLAIGGALGLLFGLIGAFGRNALDRTFKNSQDIEEHLKLPLLGVLPRTPDAKVRPPKGRRRGRNGVGNALVVHEKPNSNIAEAARALRTNLMFVSPDKPQKTLLVTSGGPYEGKTTVATWVAIAMAQAGKKVLLLDCDLRRPRLHKIFKRPNDLGVSTCVVGEQSLDQVDASTDIPNLEVVTSGPVVPNPAELLQSDRFDQFLSDLQGRYDRIVIDSPPVNAVTDAAITSTKVEGTLLVIRAHSTTRESARHSARTLRDVTENLLGVVLNDFEQRSAGYGGDAYGRYRYSYYYGSRDDSDG